MTDKEVMDIALPLIKKHEGCRLKAYTDQGGRITIGWGHTGGIQLGEEWSQEQADEELEKDALLALSQVKEALRAPVNASQMAALVDFTFNLGVSNFRRSGLLKFINLRKYAEASDQFPLWCYIGLYKSPALEARRQEERALFLKEPR